VKTQFGNSRKIENLWKGDEVVEEEEKIKRSVFYSLFLDVGQQRKGKEKIGRKKRHKKGKWVL
jgi:hypothetical protein